MTRKEKRQRNKLWMRKLRASGRAKSRWQEIVNKYLHLKAWRA